MMYRPWGSLKWILSLSNDKDWHFVGVVGTEERSLCSWSYAKSLGVLKAETFAEIQDVNSEKYRVQIERVIKLRRIDFHRLGGDLSAVHQHHLMDELYKILDFTSAAITSIDSVILDVSCFPKRFFFPILRALILSPQIRNLIVTYTSPSCYIDDFPLYEDIEPWRTLVGFGGLATGKEHWVVSIGFLVESLRQYVGNNPDEKMNVLVPFPAPLTVLRRTWKSVADLEGELPSNRFSKHRVDTLDISDAFNRICSIAGSPPIPLSFAPFGPKPISVAMCIYATQNGSSVHYPQPTVYHPEYSVGIKDDIPERAIHAYWIKHDGDNLYPS